MSTKAVTPNFRVSYPNLFKARRNQLSGKDEYSVVALFPKGADLAVLKAAAKEACEAEWGPDQKKWPKNLRLPFRDQGERIKAAIDAEKTPPSGYEEGAVFINLKSQQRPGVVDENVQPVIEESALYAGCWARASVNAFAYSQGGNNGVSFGLNNVQKVKDGEPLGGRARPEDDFAPVPGGGQTGSSSHNDLFN